MKLSFIAGQLGSSELAQLSLVNESTGQIKPDKLIKVVNAINLGLIDLYGQFLLKIGRVTVPLVADQETYLLSAVDKAVGAKMIQIHRVLDQDGREVSFNDFTNRFSVHFTQKTVMHVPKYLRDDGRVKEITIEYKSMPKQVPTCDDQLDPDFCDVELDYSYVKALCLFVASRMHAPVGLTDATYTPNIFFQMYNSECARLKDENFDLDYVAENQKAVQRGFP